MTPSASVTASAAWLLSSRVVVSLIAIAFLGITTRLLTVEQLAVFALYNSFCGLITIVSSLGLLAAGIKLLPGFLASHRPQEAARLIRLAMMVYVVLATVWTAILCLYSSTLSELFLKSSHFTGEIRLAAIASLGFGLYEASQLLLSGLQRFEHFSRNNVLTAMVQRIVSLGLFVLLGFRGYLIGFALGSILGAVYGWVTVSPAMGGAGKHPIRPDEARRQLAYAFPLYADGYLRYLYMHADQVLVGIFLSPTALSIYFIAKRFLHYCQMIVASLVTPLGTKVAELHERNPSEVVPLVVRSLRYFVLLFVPLSMILACCSPFLLWMIAGTRYAEGTLPLAILFLSVPLFAVFMHLATIVFILGKPRDRLTTNLISVIAQAAAIVILMPTLALNGLALARSLGFGVAILGARRLMKKHFAGGGTTGVGRALLRCLVPTLAMGVVILLPYLLLHNALWIPIALLPGMMICLAGYFVFVLTREDRVTMAGLVPGTGRATQSIRKLLRGSH